MQREEDEGGGRNLPQCSARKLKPSRFIAASPYDTPKNSCSAPSTPGEPAQPVSGPAAEALRAVQQVISL